MEMEDEEDLSTPNEKLLGRLIKAKVKHPYQSQGQTPLSKPRSDTLIKAKVRHPYQCQTPLSKPRADTLIKDKGRHPYQRQGQTPSPKPGSDTCIKAKVRHPYQSQGQTLIKARVRHPYQSQGQTPFFSVFLFQNLFSKVLCMASEWLMIWCFSTILISSSWTSFRWQ